MLPLSASPQLLPTSRVNEYMHTQIRTHTLSHLYMYIYTSILGWFSRPGSRIWDRFSRLLCRREKMIGPQSVRRRHHPAFKDLSTHVTSICSVTVCPLVCVSDSFSAAASPNLQTYGNLGLCQNLGIFTHELV